MTIQPAQIGFLKIDKDRYVCANNIQDIWQDKNGSSCRIITRTEKHGSTINKPAEQVAKLAIKAASESKIIDLTV